MDIVKKSGINKSSFKGFWQRLFKLGWKFQSIKISEYSVEDCPFVYLRTKWTFSKKNAKIKFIIKKHSYLMIISQNNEVILLKKAVSPNWLEEPFLEYLQETKPLKLQRLGLQNKKVQKWQKLQLQKQLEKELKLKKLQKAKLKDTK